MATSLHTHIIRLRSRPTKATYAPRLFSPPCIPTPLCSSRAPTRSHERTADGITRTITNKRRCQANEAETHAPFAMRGSLFRCVMPCWGKRIQIHTQKNKCDASSSAADTVIDPDCQEQSLIRCTVLLSIDWDEGGRYFFLFSKIDRYA